MKRMVIASGLITLLVSALSFGGVTSDRHAHQTPQPKQELSQAEYTVPEHIVYGMLFFKVAHIQMMTNELRAQGRIGQKPYFPLRQEANLTEAQAKVLEAIATACQREVVRQDEKAKLIIGEFRAQFPGGRLPKGAVPPPPPAELKAMWEERNSIILRARDRLRAALGEQEFHRFDQYAKFRYGTDDENMKRRRESRIIRVPPKL